MTRRTPLSLALTLCLLASLFALGSPAGAVDAPRGSTYSEEFFPSEDGTVLHAEVLLPEDGCDDVTSPDNPAAHVDGCPVILSGGPYFGSGVNGGPVSGITNPLYEGPSARFFDFFAYDFDTDDDGEGDTNIFEMGYAVVQVDTRGFGTSGGCNDYGGPGEQSDMNAAIEWAASQEWSNGLVGTWGKSYDAWTQVMAVSEAPEALAASVIQAPIIEGYGIAYVNGVHHDVGWYVTTDLYAGFDYIGGANVNNSTDEWASQLDSPEQHTCWAEQNVEVMDSDRRSDYWAARDITRTAGANDSDVAVFWVHGFTDVNTKPDQVFPVYDRLMANTPEKTRAWFGQWDHVRGTDRNSGGDGSQHDDWVVGRAGFNEEALDWLNHYLRGQEFAYAVNAENLVEAQDNLGEWRTERTYPAVDTRWMQLPLADATYTDDGWTGVTNQYVLAFDTGLTSQAWTVTEPVADGEEFRIAGESVISFDADFAVEGANFIGVLYDVAPNGRATEIARGAHLLNKTGRYEFTSNPADWIVEEEHRLAFLTTSAYPEYFPYNTGQEVTLTDLSITLPVPQHIRDVNLAGVQTTSRSEYTAIISNGITNANEIEFDLSPFAAIPYPDEATRIAVQGPLDPGTPVS